MAVSLILQMGHYKSNKLCPLYEQNKAAKVIRCLPPEGLGFILKLDMQDPIETNSPGNMRCKDLPVISASSANSCHIFRFLSAAILGFREICTRVCMPFVANHSSLSGLLHDKCLPSSVSPASGQKRGNDRGG